MVRVCDQAAVHNSWTRARVTSLCAKPETGPHSEAAVAARTDYRSRRPACSVATVSAIRLARVSGRLAASIQRMKFLR